MQLSSAALGYHTLSLTLSLVSVSYSLFTVPCTFLLSVLLLPHRVNLAYNASVPFPLVTSFLSTRKLIKKKLRRGKATKKMPGNAFFYLCCSSSRQFLVQTRYSPATHPSLIDATYPLRKSGHIFELTPAPLFSSVSPSPSRFPAYFEQKGMNAVGPGWKGGWVSDRATGYAMLCQCGSTSIHKRHFFLLFL